MNAMTQNQVKQRDTRIDVFRALALLTIFINHVPGTVYENLTHKNFGFSDSAEAFVLISGIAVGLAYGSKFEPGNRFLITLKAWRRASHALQHTYPDNNRDIGDFLRCRHLSQTP